METRELSRERTGAQLASELYDRSLLERRAARLIESHTQIEHDHWQQEPEINARTALFEELTAKGHLSRINFKKNPDLVNRLTLQRLLNGWSDNLPEWEQERRFSEIVEELIIQKVWKDVQNGQLPADTMVITLSNFPDNIPYDQATQMGYGVINKKGMVRATSFENGQRTVEQISRSNSNDHSTEQFFRGRGFRVGQSHSTNFLSNQLVASKTDFPNGVVDVQRALDNLAGPGIVYGEDWQPDSNLPNYSDLRRVSADREDKAEYFINQLAQFERDLDTDYKVGRMSYTDKLAAINHRRKQIVDKICLLDPSYAADARGADSVAYFKEAAMALAVGNDAVGMQYFEEALAAADPRAGVVCGGSGLTVSAEAEAKAQAGQLYLEAKDDRKFWKWKKGVCQVNVCPSRPAKTEVGPCSVCRKCQAIFDKGDDPKNTYRTLGFLRWLFGAK